MFWIERQPCATIRWIVAYNTNVRSITARDGPHTKEEHSVLGDGRLPDADVGMIFLGDKLEGLISIHICRD